jgi:hypothetical protein
MNTKKKDKLQSRSYFQEEGGLLTTVLMFTSSSAKLSYVQKSASAKYIL